MALLTKSGKDKTTATTVPWEGQQPYLEQAFSEADDIYNAPGPAYFPGSTVAPFSADQLTAQGMIRDTAASNPVGDAANQYALDVLGGNINDPYGDSVFSNIQSHVMPAINSQAMMAGREGSSAYADTMGRALTEAYAPWASQNWQFGEKQRADMARLYPQLRAMDYWDAGQLDAMGGKQQDLADRELQDAKARWDYYQEQPWDELTKYMNIVGGQEWGHTTTSTSPTTKPTDLGEILGIGTGILGSIGDIFGGKIF